MLIYPVFIPQQGCPFRCIYCNQTSFSSVQKPDFSAIAKQLDQFCRKHKTKNKQIAFYGGTFTALSLPQMEEYYQFARPFLDEKTTIRVSTRPDYVEAQQLEWCKQHQVRTIELGVQDFDDEVLAASARGYDGKTAVDACFRVKQYGIELGIQLMPGLPKSSPASRRESERTLQGVLPDFVRLYPLIVLRGTFLWDEWKAGKYEPLSLDEAIDICADYCSVAGKCGIEVIKAGIPPLAKGVEFAGPYHPALGELVQGELLIRKICAQYKGEKSLLLSNCDYALLKSQKEYSQKKLLKRLDLCTFNIETGMKLHNGQIVLA